MAAVDTTFGGVGEPAVNAVAVTPNDNSDLAVVSRALYIGSIAGGATLAVVMLGGQTVTFAGLTAGTLLPIRVTRVMSTNTLVSSIISLY